MVSWLLSVILERLPDLWLVPTMAGVGVYICAQIEPGRIKAALANLLAAGLVAAGVALLVYGIATTTYAERVRAAVEAERVRVVGIVSESLTEARAEAAAASAARIAAEKRLEEAMAAVPEPPLDDPAKPLGGGLSPASTEALLKAIGG